MTREQEIDKEIAELQQALVTDLESNKRDEESRRVYFFKPYAWMYRALDLIKTKNITVIPAPNKIGKCLCYNVVIEAESGEVSVGSLYEAGKPFKVWAWDGDKKVLANATAPFKKEGLHECYRFEMSDGRSVECADNHRILTNHGYVFAKELFENFSHSSSRSTSSQSTHASSVLRLRKTAPDYQSGCSTSLGLYGVQPPFCQESDQYVIPSRGDAQARTQLLSHLDDQACRYKYSHPSKLVHLSSLYDHLRFLGRSVGFLCQTFYTALRLAASEYLIPPPLSSVASLPLRLFGVLFQPLRSSLSMAGMNQNLLYDQILDSGQVFGNSSLLSQCEIGEPRISQSWTCPPELSSPISERNLDPSVCFSPFSFPPLMIDDTSIVSCEYIGRKEVYDFTVDKYHNYCAGGMVHHNTALNCCLMDSWCRGYEAWNEVDPKTKGAVRDVVNGKECFFSPSSLGKDPPVRIRISGEDWFKHFGQTIIPEMKKWLPMNDYTTRPNSNGFPYLWTHKRTGSTIELLTYNQDPKAAESWQGDGWIPDEPPPKSMYEGMSRGMFLHKGKVYMPTTPLSEAWILDELILKNRRDVGIINDLTILANDTLYMKDSATLSALGLNKKQIPVFFDTLLFEDKSKRIYSEDQGRRAERFLEENSDIELHEKINDLLLLRFVKDTPSDLAGVRFGGQFRALSGRILKEFDKDIHFIKPFEVPTDWPVIAMIDVALSKPQAISYIAVNQQDIKYVIKERYEHLSAEAMGDAIIKDVARGQWNLKDVYIDPLARGDAAYARNEYGNEVPNTYNKLEKRLKGHGIRLHLGSKEKESGVKSIQEALKGLNGLPTLYFFDTCARHYLEVMRWVYDKNGNFTKGTKEDYDDMMENLYRSFLVGHRYKEKEEFVSYTPREFKGNDWMMRL